jgi:ABC-2 type transport system permease protein
MPWCDLFKYEIKAIAGNKPLLITVFVGVIFYSFLYPLPYQNQTPTNLPVIIVDMDNSALSRKLTRMIDATPGVKVANVTAAVNHAERALKNEEVMGYLIIPNDFYKQLMRGQSPILSFGGDGALFLIFGTIMEGISGSILTLSAGIKIQHAVIAGDDLNYAATHFNAVGLQFSPLFNTTGGYLNYVVPAVFILILHQTLLIAVGLLGASQNTDSTGNHAYWLTTPIWQLCVNRLIVFILIYLPLFAFYLGVMFVFYDIPRRAIIGDIVFITLPFITAVVAFGMCIGCLIKRSEHVTLVVLLSSLPIVFLAGFIWPSEAIPPALLALAQFFPAIPGIKLYLGLNQLGAELYQLKQSVMQLWLLTGFYLCLSGWLLKLQRRKGH